MGSEVFKAFVQTVEAGLGAEEREPRRPDVGGNHVGAGNVQHYGKQILDVQTENGTPVGLQIADGFQLFAEPVGGLEIRHIDQAVYLAHRSVLLVDRTDFRLQHEAGFPRFHAGEVGNFAGQIFAGKRRFQAEEAAFVVEFEGVAQFLPPDGMREVARGQHVDALDSGPCRQMGKSETRTCGSGKTGMDMQVGSEHG